MKIKIVELKTKSKKLSDFRKKEWQKVHPEHFGTKQDNKLWKYQKFLYKALVDNKLAGTINGNILAGVIYVDQLIVAEEFRGKGVGKLLVQKVIKLAEKHKVHKIYLFTGVDWKAVKFYKSLGFTCEAKVKNFYESKDFWLMTKVF